MRKITHFLSATIFVLSFIPLFSFAANAQQVPDYLFLEVLDSNNKPVENAKVGSNYVFGSSYNKDYAKQEIKTDEKGNAKFYLEGNYYYFPAKSLFSISKEGYFTFNDLGFPSLEIGRTLRREEVAQVELLKIPRTKKARKIIGNEQQKRDFMWAAKTGDSATVKKFLKSGISPNLNTNDLRGVPGPKNVPAILLAAHSADSETVKTLLEAGVNISAKNELFRSILVTYLRADPFFWHKFKTEAERGEILRRYEDGVEFLLEAGADDSVLEYNVRPPIMIAAEKSYTRAVKLFLDRGFAVNGKDSEGKSLLSYAADGDYEGKISKIETVNFLLERGADPNENCGAALMNAASRGDVAVIQALLKNGAKVNLPDCGSALGQAVVRGKVAAAKILIEADADLLKVYNPNSDGNLLMIVAKNGNLEMVKLLIEKGFPVNAKTQDGSTALISAITNYSNSKFEVVKFLLKSGANPNVVIENKNPNYCPVTLTFVSEYNPELLKFLVANGADVNLACSNGDTALVEAIKRYKPELVRQLVALGANVNGENIDRAINLIKTYWKKDDYERKYVDETIKIIEDARAK